MVDLGDCSLSWIEDQSCKVIVVNTVSCICEYWTEVWLGLVHVIISGNLPQVNRMQMQDYGLPISIIKTHARKGFLRAFGVSGSTSLV